MSVKKLVIASHNAGKLKEYKGLFESYGVSVSSAGEWNLAEPEETGSTFQENALLKARYVAEHTNTLSMGDDGGLVIPALDGHPGVRSARWAEEMGGFAKAGLALEDLLKDKLPAAYFQMSLALYDPQTQQARFFEGKCFGSLSFPARGEEGFGYDSIFTPQGYDQTFAQLGIEVKKKISHRAQASSALIKALFNGGPLSKLASERGFVEESDRRTPVYVGVHEDSRTALTPKSSSEVEFPKKSTP